MAERVLVSAKKHEAKRENKASQMQKTGPSQSISSPVDQILFLQRTIGNQAVGRLLKSGALQAKLRIGQPGDKYEQEADRVAEQVMRMSESSVNRKSKSPHTSPIHGTCTDCKDELQRQVEEEEDTEEIVQTKMISEPIVPEIQREAEEETPRQQEQGQEGELPNPEEISLEHENEEGSSGQEEEEEILQTKGISDQKSEITNDLESNIYTLRSAGKPLPESSLSLFESRFGKDFSHVRVHTDTRASESARALNARAFTVGQDVIFGSGQYSPGTGEGRKLLAHELTHVVQQRQGKPNSISFSILQKNSKESVSTEKKNVSPPIYWGIDRSKGKAVAIPKSGVNLEEIATFLYGSSSASGELASINKISSKGSLGPGNPLYLTGKKLTETAYSSLNTSTKVPIGITNPEEFISKEKKLNEELQKDFDFIVKKLNERHYSDSDEGEVISVLRKWGEEKSAIPAKIVIACS
jgi:hypothetical protein